jgi:hypothetical protein
MKTTSFSTRFAIAAALMLATALVLQAYSRSEYFPPRAPLASLPSQIDRWTATDETLDQQTLNILGPGEFLLRDYERSDESTINPHPWINLFIAYFPSQKAGDTIHSPNHCLPGAGWVPTSREIVPLAAPDGSTFPSTATSLPKAESVNSSSTGSRPTAVPSPESFGQNIIWSLTRFT